MYSTLLFCVTAGILAQAPCSSGLTIEEDGIFQVSIWRDSMNYECTGSIVSSYTILTTCSCVLVDYWQDLTVYVGGETPASNGTPHRIEQVHTDPRYLTDRQGEREFDMAVVNLIEPIEFTNTSDGGEIYAIPMLSKNYQLQTKQMAEVNVFVSSSDPPYSKLEGAELTIQDYEKCNNEILHLYDGPNQICASEPGVSLCYGDLGAPLVIQDERGNRFLAGFASWATVDSWCSMDKKKTLERGMRSYKVKEIGPIIFSSIPYYMDFIVEHGRFSRDFVESHRGRE